MSGVKRHPVRGFFAGLLLGLGVALMLIVSSQIALGTLTPLVIVGVGIVIGLLWSLFGPVRRRRGAPPPTAPGPLETSAVPSDPVVPDEAPAADEGTVVEGWAPTHTAPADGLVTYAGSDEGGEPNGRLEPFLPIQAAERVEGWVRVLCSNGWSAWVDGSLLVEGSGSGGAD